MSFGFGNALTAFKPVTGGGAVGPSLSFNFLSGILDPAINFNRAGTATNVDSSGYVVDAGFLNYTARSADYSQAQWTRTNLFVQTNLLLNSATLVTQNVTTINAQPYTLSFFGAGTVTLSGTSTAGPLIGVDAVTRVSLTFTPTAGTLTLTVTGSVTSAQLVVGNVPGDYRATTSTALPVLYPDQNGVVRAQKVVENVSAVTNHQITGTTYDTTGKATTIQMKFKQGERAFAALVNVAANVARIFDLSTGTLGGTATFGAPTNSTITAAGNGWWLCTITFTGTTTSPTRFQVAFDSNTLSYSGDGTSGIYACDTQVSLWATPGFYYDTTARTTGYYAPRFYYDPVTLTPKGMLLESQATNLILNSSDYTTTSWTTGSVDVVATANQLLSPNNAVDADLITEGSLGTALLAQAITVVSGATVVASNYLKRGNTDWVRISINSGVNLYMAWVNLATGAIGTSTVGGTGVLVNAYVEYGKDGWYRLCVSGSIPATTVYQFGICSATADGSSTRVNGATYYAWGSQAEQGALAQFATTYMPTAGSAATRIADTAPVAVGAWYNSSTSTVFIEAQSMWTTGSTGTDRSMWSVVGGTNPLLGVVRASGTSIQFHDETAYRVLPNSVYTDGSIRKVVVALADPALTGNSAINGVSATFISDGTTLDSAITQFNIGYVNTTNVWGGWIRTFSYYPVQASLAECSTLTT